jgi:hypothetical protein
MTKHLHKPAPGKTVAPEFYGSETASVVDPKAPPLSGNVRFIREFYNSDGSSLSVSDAFVDGSTFHFATSAALATLGIFGRVEGLLNDFMGGGLVSVDEFALLGQSVDTFPAEINAVLLMGAGGRPVRESEVQVGRTADYGDIASMHTQVAIGIGTFAQEVVQFTTHTDGTSNLFIYSLLNSASEKARYLTEVEPRLHSLLDGVAGLTVQDVVQ